MHVSYTAQEQFTRGRELLERGEGAPALACLRRAHELDPSHAGYRSWYGVAVAHVERRLDRALELCRVAAKQEFFNPDLYHNLARVHLAFGFKAEGLRYLRRGLMIDPSHQAMLEELARLGRRRPPVLGFLPRRHALNRWLGRCRGAWVEAGRGSEEIAGVARAS